MTIRYLGKNKSFRIIEKRFWFGLLEQEELVCTRAYGKCYWTSIYWYYNGFKDTITLTRDEAREKLKKWKETRAK